MHTDESGFVAARKNIAREAISDCAMLGGAKRILARACRRELAFLV